MEQSQIGIVNGSPKEAREAYGWGPVILQEKSSTVKVHNHHLVPDDDNRAHKKNAQGHTYSTYTYIHAHTSQ